ncbi:Exostosin family protein [Theobroma cacao]|uniref:Exostosin family protein n=1 Tax=Theobroma cacao TaxID=3641 RepID=A0A061DY65_THECC|nr:Exostosin family protein [Theobroma cacao]
MSRCLPFPPPEYVRNGVSGEALLELIKGKRRRRKGGARKRRKEREQGEICRKKPGHHERHKRLKSNEGGGRSENQGKTAYGTQEMESSSLTEELMQPISDSFYESSDNSQSIHKKRNSRSRNECHNDGNIVQMDIQQQKHKTPEALSRKPDCSTIMMDSVVQKKLELPVDEQFSSASGVPATDVHVFVPPPLRKLCHSSQTTRIYMDEESKMTLTEQFRELVESWLPCPLQIEQFDVGDQEGLFERKSPRCDICETSNASNDVLYHGYSNSCPYGQCLLHSLLILDSGVQKKLELDPTPVKVQLSSDCGVPATDEKSEMAPTSSCSEISLLQIESQFRELVANWLPPSLQAEHFDIGDQDWLFETKQPRSDINDTSNASYDVLHQGDFTQYPCAQILPQANIYALPVYGTILKMLRGK